jgi:AcrR family transcriptional regulator
VPAKTYHHPDLRNTLLDAAVTLIGEVGPRAFTLREVARRAGVSHNAPYRHFDSRDDLLRVVALEGFDRLKEVMQKTLAPGKTPIERLELCGCGYVDFALSWPNHLQVMFDVAPTPHAHNRGNHHVGENAFLVLLNCIQAAQSSGDLPAGDPMPLALTSWSLVHGIAKLAIGGNLHLDRKATIAFTHKAAQTLFSGMAKKTAPKTASRLKLSATHTKAKNKL